MSTDAPMLADSAMPMPTGGGRGGELVLELPWPFRISVEVPGVPSLLLWNNSIPETIDLLVSKSQKFQ